MGTLKARTFSRTTVGALLAMGIAAAYVRKLTTGEGTRVEGSLFAAGFDIQTEPREGVKVSAK